MSDALKLYDAIREKSDKRWKIWNTFEDGELVHIADVAVYDEKKDRLKVVRMVLADYRNVPISLSFLKKPAEQQADTSKWDVDKTLLLTPIFATAMIEAMFFSGSVEPDYQTKAKVLQIGVGGGGMYNFIQASFPNIDLTGVELSTKMVDNAKKWFQLHTSPTHRCIVEDGIHFVEKAAERGDKYDVVLIDACYNGFEHAGSDHILGPVPPFREVSFLENVKKALTSRGSVTFNVISGDGNEATHKVALEFETQLKQVFDYTCKVFSDYNYAVTAAMMPIPEPAEIRKKIDALNFRFEADPTHDVEGIY